MASEDTTVEIVEPAVEDQIQTLWDIKFREAVHDIIAKCRVCLKDDKETRSFWIDNLLTFLDTDTIPQGLIDHLSNMKNFEFPETQFLFILEPWFENLFILEPWLRAAAQQGYFEEEDQALKNLLPHFPTLRLFTAWVAAENGHEQMVLALMKGLDANISRGLLWELTNSRWVYFIWQFLMQRGCFATQWDISFWKELERFSTGAGDWRKDDNWRFLHFAAACGDVTCIEELLKQDWGNDVDRPTKEAYTALHLAAYYDNVAIVNSLLGHGADVNARDETGRTPLHHASEQGCLASVNALLEHALNKESAMKLVEMVDVNGMSALHLASCRGQTQVVTALLSHAELRPANLCLIKSHGKDLTHEKAFIARSLRQWRDSQLAEIHLDYRLEGIIPLEACFNAEASTFLRPNRLKSQVWSPGGFSALHFAVVYGNNIDTIHEILKHEESEALVMIKDSLGLTPIDWAQVVDRKEAQEILEAKALKILLER